jgi:hypothetical protein
VDRPSKVQRKDKTGNDGGKRGRKKGSTEDKALFDSPTTMSASVLSSLMSTAHHVILDVSNDVATTPTPVDTVMAVETATVTASEPSTEKFQSVSDHRHPTAEVPMAPVSSTATTVSSPSPPPQTSSISSSQTSNNSSPASGTRRVPSTPLVKTEENSDESDISGDDLSDHSHIDGASSEDSNDTEQTIQSLNCIPINSEGSALRVFSQILLARHRKPYVRNLLNRVDVQQTTTCLYLIAHLQEIMIPEHFKKFLFYIGYAEKKEMSNPSTLNSTSGSPMLTDMANESISNASMAPPKHKRTRTVYVHPHNHFLPTITYPTRFHFNWSLSPTECMSDSGVMATFATLVICKPSFEYQRGKKCCYCACACNGHINGTSHIPSNEPQQTSPITSPSPTLSSISHSPYTPDFPVSTSSSSQSSTSSAASNSLTQPEEGMHFQSPSLNSRSSTQSASTASSTSSAQNADLSTFDLHLIVHANAAFERLFGYSQQEIRVMFLREGKRALFRLTKDESWSRAQRNDYSSASIGQTEFKHFVVCVNKVLSEFGCLMVRKLSVDENGLFHAASYTFIPLPTYSHHVREEMNVVQQAIPKVQPVVGPNW